ncbi:MAG: hypothetical protein KJI72_03410 [Patescibacteria group bacterium]|nr:hypothetical protein [Patescibacteria group bacterium]
MSKKSGIVTFLVIILIVVGVVFLSKGDEERNETIVPPTAQEDTTGVDEESRENLVVYADDGFSPRTMTVRVGDVVTFENRSQVSMWVASALHPTHGLYPVSGGCIGSAFDACEGIDSGFSWSFTFNEKGTWKYHDHLNARFTGTIVVE